MKTLKNILFGLLVVTTLLLVACETTHEPINKDSIIQSESKWLVNALDNSKINIVYLKEYDLNSNLIRYTQYKIGAENPGQNTINFVSEYLHDNLHSKEIKQVFDNDGNIIEVDNIEYLYDSKGNVLKKTLLKENGEIEQVFDYVYDNKGNLSITLEYDASLNLINETKIQYIYNNAGLVMERIINPTDNGNFQSRDSLSYSASKNSVDVVKFGSSGDIQTITTLIYNTKGKLISEIITSIEGDIMKKYNYDYVFY